jgi:aryl-alcohol dehydrogenase-like predicted oxidoreductase
MVMAIRRNLSVELSKAYAIRSCSQPSVAWSGTKKEGDKFFDADEHGLAESDQDKKYEVYINLRPAMIRHEIEESLRRLKTDRIDLYLTHWQDSTTKTEDAMAELMKLKQEGKMRAIGCSNATVEQMKRYQSVGQLDVDQEQYSMLQREHEADNLPFCVENNIAFLAHSPSSERHGCERDQTGAKETRQER